MTIEQKPNALQNVPKIKARLEIYDKLKSIRKLDGHELPPFLEGVGGKILEIMIVKHALHKTTTYKNLAPIFGEPIATPNIRQKIIHHVSNTNKVLERRGSRWTIINIPTPEDKARRIFNNKDTVWDLAWDQIPKTETVVLPNGIKHVFPEGNAKGKALKLLIEKGKVPQSVLESLLLPEQLKALKKIFEKYGLGLGLTYEKGETFYHLEKPDSKTLVANSTDPQNNPETQNKDVSTENLEIIRETIGVDFVNIILSGIASGGLKTISRNPDEILKSIIENNNTYFEKKIAEIMKFNTAQERLRKIAEIKSILVDKSKAKAITKYILTETLAREWNNNRHDPKISEKQRILRYYGDRFRNNKGGEISAETVVKVTFRHFEIPFPTSGTAQKSPEAPTHS